jgi:hypothetical protein
VEPSAAEFARAEALGKWIVAAARKSAPKSHEGNEGLTSAWALSVLSSAFVSEYAKIVNAAVRSVKEAGGDDEDVGKAFAYAVAGGLQNLSGMMSAEVQRLQQPQQKPN